MRLPLIALTAFLVTETSLFLFNASGADSPFLEGHVTDQLGRPIEGATVTIMDCIGTCFGGDARVTDRSGHYVFNDKTFRNWPFLSVSMPGRYHVATDYSGPKLSEDDSDKPRRAEFVLGNPAALSVRVTGKIPEAWTQSIFLRAGRDVTLHRYDLSGDCSDDASRCQFDIVPRFETVHVVIVHRPVVTPSDDPQELRERKRDSQRKQVEVISPGLRLIDPQRYRINLELQSSDEGTSFYVNLVSIVDALGQDRTDELSVADPLFGPPVKPVDRQRALQLLKRVALAATPWNARPSKSITYQYDAVNAKGERTEVTIDKDSPTGPAWSDISRLRGFAYMPPLRWLFSQPENVVIHDVQTLENTTVLTYRLKERRGFSAGLGVGPGWNGFFSRSFSSGRMVIDTEKAVVTEHRISMGPLGEESIETFSDMVPMGGGYVPRSIRIQSGDADYRLRFKCHQDQLWLLDRATHGDSKNPALRIEKVSVDLSANE
ncbi:hypothetical protein CA13_38640 [Planctomycetes bacterium CA13]|uniref:Carboxypeptidase regulatory-like domain-containing protein n=1 Tax=Novipirellula herctigrandis TaxID=2527986 RepID=A0A5C5Z6F4_9BACT|nr:hypothetical protein CA13_38640 [Planctomycetes bacterium CA13]